MARGMHKGPRNTREANSQWAPKENTLKKPVTRTQARQSSFDNSNHNSSSKTLMHRPGSNKK